MQLNHLAIPYLGPIHGYSHKSTCLVPPLFACRSGIYMEQVKSVVPHDFKDMGVSVHRETDPLFFQYPFQSWRPFAGIASYVREQYFHAFHGKNLQLVAFASDHPVVHVACHRPYGAYFLQLFYNGVIPDVTGMPYFIASGKILTEPFVPASMGVTQYSDFLHNCYIANIMPQIGVAAETVRMSY